VGFWNLTNTIHRAREKGAKKVKIKQYGFPSVKGEKDTEGDEKTEKKIVER